MANTRIAVPAVALDSSTWVEFCEHLAGLDHMLTDPIYLGQGPDGRERFIGLCTACYARIEADLLRRLINNSLKQTLRTGGIEALTGHHEANG